MVWIQPGVQAGVGGTLGWTTSTTTAGEVARREVRRQRRQAVVSCGKRVVAFFFSHVGLAAMVVAYSILGGFLFRALEAPHEQRVKVGDILCGAENAGRENDGPICRA